MFCNQEFPMASDMSDNSNQTMDMNQGCNQSIMSCPQERCVHKEFHHTIEHVVPINTRIINHHIYHHVYKPVYTCCEENVCSETNC